VIEGVFKQVDGESTTELAPMQLKQKVA
jgi:hypothetical protein